MANLNLITIFLAVAETENITKAAEKLFISQPAITSSIKKFEEEMGGKLFVRQNKGVKLTAEGQYIYIYLKRYIGRINNIYKYFEKEKKLMHGILRIGTSTSNITKLLNKYIQKFVHLYPNIDIQVTRGTEDNLLSSLENGDLDMLIIDNEYKTQITETIKSFSVEYSIIGNKDSYEKYKDKPITREEFINETLAMTNAGKTSRENIDAYFHQYGLEVHPKYEFENYGLIIDFVKSGYAIGVANLQYFEKELANHEIFELNSAFQIDKRQIIAVISKEKHTNPSLDKFIEILTEGEHDENN